MLLQVIETQRRPVLRSTESPHGDRVPEGVSTLVPYLTSKSRDFRVDPSLGEVRANVPTAVLRCEARDGVPGRVPRRVSHHRLVHSLFLSDTFYFRYQKNIGLESHLRVGKTT